MNKRYEGTTKSLFSSLHTQGTDQLFGKMDKIWELFAKLSASTYPITSSSLCAAWFVKRKSISRLKSKKYLLQTKAVNTKLPAHDITNQIASSMTLVQLKEEGLQQNKF